MRLLGFIVFAALGAMSCSPAESPLNEKDIEAQIANCGLKFTNPVWEMREERRPALKLTVPDPDSVTDTTTKCVTDISMANNFETQMNADGDQAR